jgi:hypothetical protein
MNKLASADAHSTATDTLEINKSDCGMDSDIPGPGMGSNLGAIHEDDEVFDDNLNDGSLMCTDQVDQALDLPVTPFVPSVSQSHTEDQVPNPPPTTPSTPPLSPPSPPLAPGSPSSPIENAFACLTAAAASLPINIPACRLVPGDESIDPILRDMVNHTGPADYRLPGAVVDHDLATPVTEYQRPRKRCSPPGKKRG